MKEEGQIALIPFPHKDLSAGKMRPVLPLRRASLRFDDWLVCMVSTQLHQAEPGLDEIVAPGEADFDRSGLKTASAIRTTRLAVVDGALLVGCIGEIDGERLGRIRHRLANWLTGRT